jgi:hypothetical protein
MLSFEETESYGDEIVNTGGSFNRFLREYKLGKEDWICNVVGTSHEDPKVNWKGRWVAWTCQKWPTQCRYKDCERKATDGGHMYLRDHSRHPRHLNYIIPICSHHNNPLGNYNFRGDFKDATNWQPPKVAHPGTTAVVIPQHPDVFAYNIFVKPVASGRRTAKPISPREHVSPSKPKSNASKVKAAAAPKVKGKAAPKAKATAAPKGVKKHGKGKDGCGVAQCRGKKCGN